MVATREPGGEFGGLPELAVGGLGDGDARELLASVIRRPLDERVRELTPAELAGAFGVTAAPGLLRRLEDSFRQRLGELPETTQRLLLRCVHGVGGRQAGADGPDAGGRMRGP